MSIKKILAILFSACLLGGGCILAASAETDGDWTYTVANNEATVTGYTGTATDVTFPARLGGYSAVNTQGTIFPAGNAVQSITIPPGYLLIRSNAFNNCPSLESVTLPAGLMQINDNVFENCASLENIAFPNSVISIGNFVLRGCTSLESVTLPTNLRLMGYNLFSGCRSLRGIIVPEGITWVGNYMFSNCTGLESITLPSSLTDLGFYAFENCVNLRSIVIPNGVKQILVNTFEGCTSLGSVTLPAGLTRIDVRAFANCAALEGIFIPASVTSIGSQAFDGCASGFTITGYYNSTARTYAESNRIPFIAVDAFSVAVTGGTADKTTAVAGDTVTITAGAAPAGQRFKQWNTTPAVSFTGGTSAASATAKFTMPAGGVTATAIYENIPVTPPRGIFGTNARWYGAWWHYLLFFLLFGFIWMWF